MGAGTVMTSRSHDCDVMAGPCRISSLPPEPVACMERLPECCEERERRRNPPVSNLGFYRGLVWRYDSTPVFYFSSVRFLHCIISRKLSNSRHFPVYGSGGDFPLQDLFSLPTSSSIYCRKQAIHRTPAEHGLIIPYLLERGGSKYYTDIKLPALTERRPAVKHSSDVTALLYGRPALTQCREADGAGQTPECNNPMFTLVTRGLRHRWSLESCLCDSSPATTQRRNGDAAAIGIVGYIAAASLNVTVPLLHRIAADSTLTFGNILYLLLFGWWISLFYLIISVVMFISIVGFPYGVLCWRLAIFFVWPFGKIILQSGRLHNRKCLVRFSKCEAIPEVDEVEKTLLIEKRERLHANSHSCEVNYWMRLSTYIWLFVGYPVLAVVHGLACLISWLSVFFIPVSKMNGRVFINCAFNASRACAHTPRKP
ncbi:unnamed protein product, partial [Ranitomeya imitator]